MIPAIARDHILSAFSRIDRDGVPRVNESRGVEVRYNCKAYPPKYVVSLAVEIATGQALPSSRFITTEAEHRLRGLGFEIARGPEQPLEAGPAVHQDAATKTTSNPVQHEEQLHSVPHSLKIGEEVRKRAQEALDFVRLSPEASIRAARAALIATVREMGAPGTLDQAIRGLEDGNKISQITAIQMRTIQKIRNKVEYESARVSSDDAQTCAAALLAVLKKLAAVS